MAKSTKVHLIMSDLAGVEWVNVETTEAKAKALVKQYQKDNQTLGTPALRAAFKPVAA